MQPPEVDRDSLIRTKLDALDVVEKEIGAVRPRSQVRENVLLFVMLACTIGAGVAVSIHTSAIGMWVFGLLTFSTLAAWIGVIAPRHKLKALEWKREQLLSEIGEPPTEA